jgi:hypothetical protein
MHGDHVCRDFRAESFRIDVSSGVSRRIAVTNHDDVSQSIDNVVYAASNRTRRTRTDGFIFRSLRRPSFEIRDTASSASNHPTAECAGIDTIFSRHKRRRSTRKLARTKNQSKDMKTITASSIMMMFISAASAFGPKAANLAFRHAGTSRRAFSRSSHLMANPKGTR